MGFCAEGVLGHDRDPGGHRGSGVRIFETGDRDFHFAGIQHGALGPGDFSESNYFSVRVFSGACGTGSGNLKQFSRVCAAGIDFDSIQSGVYRVFAWDRIQADSSHHAAGLSDTGARAGDRNIGRFGIATGDADSGTMETGHALSRGGIVPRSGSTQGREADGSGFLWHGRLSD